jgi:hypothetical protein
MSSASCACCVVVLNQQPQQSISQQNQVRDIPVKHCQKSTQNCTVVENGRVVVKAVDILNAGIK